MHTNKVNPPSFVRRLCYFGIAENLRKSSEHRQCVQQIIGHIECAVKC